jgi:Ctr copper transporter family
LRQPLIVEILNGIKEMSIFAFHNALSYGLMLAVMMYNGYIFIAVVLGAFVGYFLFGHISMKTNMENLQAIQTKIICSSRCAESGEFFSVPFRLPSVSLVLLGIFHKLF